MHIGCGGGVDTRLALGGDTGSYHSERRANALTSPKIIYTLRATHRLTAPRVSHICHHRRLPAPPGYPQTPHTMYSRFHSSEGPWKPKSVCQSHSRFSRRLGGTYSNLASRGSSHITHGSHLRLAEVPPQELEHFIHGIGRIHQQIGLP